MTENKKYLSDLILRFMAQKRYDQKEMAALLGIQPSTLCSWLNPVGHGITRKNAERIKFVCRDVLAENGNPIQDPSNGEAKNASSIETFRTGLIGAFIDSDLDPESLQKVLKIVKNYKG